MMIAATEVRSNISRSLPENKTKIGILRRNTRNFLKKSVEVLEKMKTFATEKNDDKKEKEPHFDKKKSSQVDLSPEEMMNLMPRKFNPKQGDPHYNEKTPPRPLD
jgi:hypothetical protein